MERIYNDNLSISSSYYFIKNNENYAKNSLNNNDSYENRFGIITLSDNNLKNLNLTSLLYQSENFFDSSFEAQPLLRLYNNDTKKSLEEIDKLYDSLLEIKTIKIQLSINKNNNSMNFCEQNVKNKFLFSYIGDDIELNQKKNKSQIINENKKINFQNNPQNKFLIKKKLQKKKPKSYYF